MSEHLHTTDRTLYAEAMTEAERELTELHTRELADAKDAVTGQPVEPKTAVVISADGKTVALDGTTFDQLASDMGRRTLTHTWMDDGPLPDDVVAAYTHLERVVVDGRTF